MDPDKREAWAKRLMDDPKVNGDAEPTGTAGDPSVVMDGFAEAMLRRQRERRE